MGSYTLQIIASDQIGGAKSLPVFFTLNLDCRVTKINQIPDDSLTQDYTYTIGQQAMLVMIPKYITTPNGCNKPLRFSLLTI